jgi:type III pantothenate kinase
MTSIAVIALDSGNTLAKVAAFSAEGKLISVDPTAKTNLEAIAHSIIELALNYDIYNLGVANVGLAAHELESILRGANEMLWHKKNKIFNINIFKGNSKGILKNHYLSPGTLGVDRWMAINAAATKRPNQPVLVVSLGTALTLDYANENGEYTGGVIAPGLTMRYQGLHHYTHALPLLSPVSKIPSEGNTTETAIQIGVQKGLLAEIEFFISEFSKRSSQNLAVLATGGDLKYLEPYLDNYYQEPNLVLEGIYYLYLRNVERSP